MQVIYTKQDICIIKRLQESLRPCLCLQNLTHSFRILSGAGGALRLVADCGPGLIGLLRQLQAAGVAPRYIQKVLMILEAQVVALIVPSTSPGADTAVRPEVMVEMLTNREIDVLTLLAERLTDKEIAERLVLSGRSQSRNTPNAFIAS